MRDRFDNGHETKEEIARSFGIKRSVASDAISGRTWNWLPITKKRKHFPRGAATRHMIGSSTDEYVIAQHAEEEYYIVEGIKVGKRCTMCHAMKHMDGFYSAKDKKDNKESHCKECGSWRRREHKYGITRQEFEAKFEAQGGGCAICGDSSPLPRGRSQDGWVVDHDHKTGKARGILCYTCNQLLGGIEQDNYEASVRYLTLHSDV